MAKRIGGGNVYRKPTPKKTRQGMGRNTKYGHGGGGHIYQPIVDDFFQKHLLPKKD